MTFFVQFLIDATLLGGLYTLMAVGLALGLGVTRIINFAHGEFIMLGAYAAFFGVAIFGIDPLISLAAISIGIAGLGVVIFKIAVQKVLGAPHINQILLMFGVSLVLQNLAAIVFSGDERSVRTPYSLTTAEIWGLWIPHGRLISFVIAMVLFCALLWWLKRTELGRATQAVAQNGDAATLMGINVNAVYLVSFAISAGLAAATGVAVSFLLTITPFMGFHMLVKAFAIVVLGGLGSIGGTFIGAFALAFAETAIAYYVPEGIGWAEGVAFAVLLGMLIVRPRGILGQAVEEEG